MHSDLEYPEQIDGCLDWAPGTALRLARRGKLPHYVLPDGSIRLNRGEVESLIRYVPRLDLASSEFDPAGGMAK